MSEDLSIYHQPITDIFPHPENSDEFSLSEEQIEFFHENGYLAGIKMLSDGQIEILRGELDDLMKSEKPRRAVVINVLRDGVSSDTNASLLEGVPVIPKGEKINGQFFPLLIKENKPANRRE